MNGLVRMYVRQIRSTADKNPTETDEKNFKTDENEKSAPSLPKSMRYDVESDSISGLRRKKIAKVSIIEFGVNEER